MKGIIFTVRKSTKKIAPSYYLKRYGIYILLTAFLILGTAIGAVISENSAIGGAVSGFFGTDAAARADTRIVAVFSANLCASFALMLVAFMLGICAAGTPFLPIAVALKGIGIGNAAATLLADFGAKGILFYLLTCLAGDMIFVIALYSETRRALALSAKLAKTLLFNKAEDFFEGGDIKEFVLHSSYMLLLTAVAAAVNTALHFIFAGISSVS